MLPLPVLVLMLAAGITLSFTRWLYTRQTSALFGIALFVLLGIARLTPSVDEVASIGWTIDILVIATGVAFGVSGRRELKARQ